uniref:SHSP domain-containing protein n=1 Tax=Vitis vinifera TaxID=29760 RepID=A5BP27_VITVI|nr:hypothetical protein VITISV_034591 [Vitis vinifera]
MEEKTPLFLTNLQSKQQNPPKVRGGGGDGISPPSHPLRFMHKRPTPTNFQSRNKTIAPDPFRLINPNIKPPPQAQSKYTGHNKKKKMNLRSMGLDSSMQAALQDMLDMYKEPEPDAKSRTYMRDRKAMVANQADVKEYSNSYVFLVDMPGLKADKIKVHIEDENVLVVL